MTSMPPNPPLGVPPQEPQWQRPPQLYPPAPRDGRGASFFVAIFLGILLVVSGGLNVLLLLVSFSSIASSALDGVVDEDGAGYDVVRVGGSAGSQKKVMRIKIHGAIAEAQSPMIGATGGTVSHVRRALRVAAADEDVRGILLDIDSPGGGVTDSDEIYRMLLQYREQHAEVKMLALFGDMAASGGYYVAAAAERIVARPTTITGSIGVIMSAWNFAEAAEKLGIEQISIVSASTPFKDLLSPTRPVRDAERALLTTIVDEFYRQFVDIVDHGRPALDREQVQKLADGRIYTAQQALDNGLVDDIGGSKAAEAWFEQAMGEVEIIECRRRPSFRDLLFGVRAPAVPTLESVAGRLLTASSGPRFLYFWQGAR